MKYERKHEIRISGYYSGLIWMPMVKCEKFFDRTYTRASKESGTLVTKNEIPAGVGWLDNTLVDILNDGDFQSCAFEQVRVEVTYFKGNRSWSRYWHLDPEEYPHLFDEGIDQEVPHEIYID